MTAAGQSLESEPAPPGAVPDGSVTVSLPVPGFLTIPPLEIGTGVSVVTGINNVGKSRLLRYLHQLRTVDQPYSSDDLDVTIRNGDETGVLHVRPTQFRDAAQWTVMTGSRVLWHDAVSRVDGRSNYTRSSQMPAHASGVNQTWASREFPPLAWICGGRPAHLNRLRALSLVDAQRKIPGVATATRTREVNPDGSNLGEVLYTHLNDRTEAFRALEQLMTEMFPEVDGVLTKPIERLTSVQLAIRDRFSGMDVSLDECGTGVAQVLYFVAAVLTAPRGRIFLVDDPHVYLHAQAERALATFLRTHQEHSYVVATHSAVFIDGVEPDRTWHLTRDAQGTTVHGVLQGDTEHRRVLFRTLGWRPSQFAWAERVLFVEGDSDAQIYPTWFRRWGWNAAVTRCAVVDMGGAGGQEVARRIAGQLSQCVSLDQRVLLDGDQRGTTSDSTVLYLPESDVEALLLRDIRTVREVLLESRAQDTGEPLEDLHAQWPVEQIETVLRDMPNESGGHQMSRLAHEVGVSYKKTRHGPQIAERMDLALLEDMRTCLGPFVTGTPGAFPSGHAGDVSG